MLASTPDELESLSKQSPKGLPDADLLNLIAVLVDGGVDFASRPALDRAWKLSDELLERPSSEPYRSRAYYCRANIHRARRYGSGDQTEWVWSSASIDGEILELRKALRDPSFRDADVFQRAQLYTNLANVLNHVGRFVEAVEAWDRAIAILPNFGKALGNRGVGLGYYARALYDENHQAIFWLQASKCLGAASGTGIMWDDPDHDTARAVFAGHLKLLERNLDLKAIEASFNPDDHSMGRSKAEQRYRRWCHEKRLFLNPLNDLGDDAIANQDTLTLPPLVVEIDEGPSPPAAIHYFNLLKQEYCAARFALHEGISRSGIHYSDKDVLLFDTHDYSAHGFGIERIKMAYRGAYALFDKIAFLLNGYFQLGHSERHVNFRNLWFKRLRGKALHPKLEGLANWPLRGLYWLSKDIFEEEFRNTTEPDASELYELRNHLEHKYVGVHDEFFSSARAMDKNPAIAGKFDISTTDLERRTLRLLNLTRAALIYLSLAIHAEERKRDKKRQEGLVATMPLYVLRDDWKFVGG